MINPDALVQLGHVGTSKTPILVIDNFFADFEALVEHVKKEAVFRPARSAYPGDTADLPRDMMQAIAEFCWPLITKTHNIPDTYKAQIGGCYLGMVSRDVEDLEWFQRIPHIDFGVSDQIIPHTYVGLVYLADGPFSGTGFYRHTPTGLEVITNQDSPNYFNTIIERNNRIGPEKAAYYSDGDLYERIGKVDYQPNRLVVYPSALLHSGLIDDPSMLSSNSDKGRLAAHTGMRFFDPRFSS